MQCYFWKKFVFVIFIASVPVLPYPVPTAALAQETIDPTSFELVFNDDFDGLDVTAWGPGSRWIAHTPWNGDFGDARFVDPGPDFPFTTRDGILRIEARKGANGKWQSGLLASTDGKGDGFKQKYGYFEMRARFPAGEGVWPAFWLASRGEEKAIEVDVVEHYGHFPGRYTASLHIWDRKAPALSKSFHERVPVDAGALSTDFHSYGVAIDASRIRYFFDRREIWSIETPRELAHPFTILIDLGLGAGWPIENTPDPSVMEVDFVRVWSLPPD
ncbi:glycoside hydrolase family 16 protein [Rhizobium giardinii]